MLCLLGEAAWVQQPLLRGMLKAYVNGQDGRLLRAVNPATFRQLPGWAWWTVARTWPPK